jgi:hypothetical protein
LSEGTAESLLDHHASQLIAGLSRNRGKCRTPRAAG